MNLYAARIKWFKIGAILFVVVLLLSALLFFFVSSSPKNPTLTPLEVTPAFEQSDEGTPVESTTPPEITTSQATIVSVSKSGIVLTSNNQTQTFTFSDNVNIQRLVSGTLEKNPKIDQAKLSDLVTGMEVVVATKKGSTVITGILILK